MLSSFSLFKWLFDCLFVRMYECMYVCTSIYQQSDFSFQSIHTKYSRLYSVTERPANRVEIDSLDRELEDRVKSVLYGDVADLNALETGDLYQPHKDAILLIRDHMLQDFNVPLHELPHEQWLDKLIKCECLKDVCDHVASVLNDMLSVTSSELGSVLRKLRFTYKQSFHQMNVSTRQLFGGYMDSRRALDRCVDELSIVTDELAKKEEEMLMLVEQEMSKVNKMYETQHAVDKETISQVIHSKVLVHLHLCVWCVVRLCACGIERFCLSLPHCMCVPLCLSLSL